MDTYSLHEVSVTWEEVLPANEIWKGKAEGRTVKDGSRSRNGIMQQKCAEILQSEMKPLLL